jgi:hypothetical protein
MHPRERLHKALQKLVHARASIVRTAAEWQAQGVETSPLTEPMVEIQEAVAQLETLAASLPGPGPTTRTYLDAGGRPVDPSAGS